MADQITGDAQVANTRMELILALVQRELAAAAKLLPTVTDVTRFAEKGVDSISFPKFGSFSAGKKTSGTPVDAQTLSDSVDKLELSEHAVVQYLIEKKASKQTRVELEMEYAARAASAHGRGVDVDIFTELLAGRLGANDVEFDTAISKDNILEMRQNLDDQYAPEEGRVLVITPAQERAMLNIQEFIDASRFGDRAPIYSGFIGQVYGIPVIKSSILNQFVGSDDCHALMYHSEALAIGFQIMPEYDEDKDLANLATRYSIDQLYGVKSLQGGKMCSALIDAV